MKHHYLAVALLITINTTVSAEHLIVSLIKTAIQQSCSLIGLRCDAKSALYLIGIKEIVSSIVTINLERLLFNSVVLWASDEILTKTSLTISPLHIVGALSCIDFLIRLNSSSSSKNSRRPLPTEHYPE